MGTANDGGSQRWVHLDVGAANGGGAEPGGWPAVGATSGGGAERGGRPAVGLANSAAGQQLGRPAVGAFLWRGVHGDMRLEGSAALGEGSLQRCRGMSSGHLGAEGRRTVQVNVSSRSGAVAAAACLSFALRHCRLPEFCSCTRPDR